MTAVVRGQQDHIAMTAMVAWFASFKIDYGDTNGDNSGIDKTLRNQTQKTFQVQKMPRWYAKCATN
jgi:hypothetical protein